MRIVFIPGNFAFILLASIWPYFHLSQAQYRLHAYLRKGVIHIQVARVKKTYVFLRAKDLRLRKVILYANRRMRSLVF